MRRGLKVLEVLEEFDLLAIVYTHNPLGLASSGRLTNSMGDRQGMEEAVGDYAQPSLHAAR